MFASPVARAHTKAGASSTNKVAQQRSKPVPRRWSELGTQHEQEAGPVVDTRTPDPGFAHAMSWDFSKIPVSSPDRSKPNVAAPLPRAIQPKLSGGQINDRLEHEAETAAELVTRVPDLRSVNLGSGDGELGGEKAHPLLARNRMNGTSSPGLEVGPPIVREILRSPGQPLDAATQEFFEPRFGWNFSRVRVHMDARAARSASVVHAQAFAVGERIVFGAGRYAPAGFDGRRLIAHELAHVIQQSRTGTPRIQCAPDRDPGEIEMEAVDFPANPALIKSRRGKTDWIRDPSPRGSLNEKQWTENRNDIKKLYSDVANVAQVAKVFEGPAAVPRVTDAINIIKDEKSAHHFLPGLNYSHLYLDRGGTFYVSANGGEPSTKLSPNRTETLPKIAIVLGPEAFSSKEFALGVLRHEMVHAEHLNLALKEAKKWQADAKTKSGFEVWLNEQYEKGRLPALDLVLILNLVHIKKEGEVTSETANTELLAYTEEFMTEFLLTRQAPGDNNDPAFLPLFGVISSSSEPWANANIAVRSEALGRILEYFCHVLDRPHQEAFERFVRKPPSHQTPVASGWTWAPKRQMHQHFFDGLKRIIDAKCAGLGGKSSK